MPQMFKNGNSWLALAALTIACALPDMVWSGFSRRFRTSFQHLAQEVEQLKWYKLAMNNYHRGLGDIPVHKELDELDKKLWRDETSGQGTSNGYEHTGKDFSMDDYTSMKNASTFRSKIHKHNKATGVVNPQPPISPTRSSRKMLGRIEPLNI